MNSGVRGAVRSNACAQQDSGSIAANEREATADRRLIMAGDLGGTNFRVQARLDGTTIFAKRYSNVREFNSLEQLIAKVVDDLDFRPDVTCLAVAGPVAPSGREAHLTNLGWSVNAASLENLGIGRVVLLNDFEAIALGITSLDENELIKVGGDARKPGDAVVLGPGTGLGVAFLWWTGTGYVTKPTENGHREWPARSELEWAIRGYIAEVKREAGGTPTYPARVSFEDVVSGRGLVNVYRALRQSAEFAALGNVLENGPPDAPAAISEGAKSGNRACIEALRIFYENLAVFAGDLALHSVPGGVYIAGGIVTKNLEAFFASGFRQTFENKQPQEAMLKSTPVFIICTEKELGVEGAALKASSV